MTTIFINELHYENVGVDTKEGVEIAAPAGTSLDGWAIHLYRGSDGKTEGSVRLRGIVPSLQNGWGVLFFKFELKNHSHGTGLALVNPEGKVVQFISYRAQFSASNGVAAGLDSSLLPVEETMWTKAGLSLQLQGKGNKYEDFRWVGPAKATYGNVNTGQSFEPSVSPISPSPATVELEGIDLFSEVNRTKHHTDKFHGTELLILRRGDIFQIGLKSTNLDVNNVILRFKVYPEGQEKAVKVVETEPESTDPGAVADFVAFVDGKANGLTKISIRIPGNAVVGEYLFSVTVDKGRNWTAESHLVILFNAWSRYDPVFLQQEEERKEYVLADDGLIWVGNQYQNSPRAWNFAQFNTKSLLAVLKLIQSVAVKERGDPVLVSRKMSALVNAQHDGGVLSGNWSGDYSGGTSPSAWTGSGEILKEYLLTEKPVKFAQCWVFSGVLTTVMRCLGVPARSVTNFASAHDVPVPNYNRSVDKYFKRGGLEEDESKTRDSIWNFHVWNDVWMERADLGPQHFGWQAIDATPQEMSGGTYQTGPAPISAIKEGLKGLNYDLEFIYSEVNADENYYVERDDGKGYDLVRTVTNSVGQKMSTKAVGSNARQDVTLDYKYAEGTVEERASHGGGGGKAGDVAIRWEVDDHAPLGTTVTAKLIVEAKAEARDVKVQLVVTSIQYTGKQRKTIQEKQQVLSLRGGTSATVDFSLPPKAYERYLYGDNSFLFKAYIEVQQTQQVSVLLREFDFKNFELQLDMPSNNVPLGSDPTVTVTFTNKLTIPLTNLVLTVDGQGLTKIQVFNFPSLKPGEVLKQAVVLRVLEKGKHLLIAELDAAEISDIKGHEEILVQ